MTTQTDRKIAEEERKTFEVQEAAQKQRQQLARQTAIADIQQQVVGAEQGVNIAELKANANVKQATGEADPRACVRSVKRKPSAPPGRPRPKRIASASNHSVRRATP